MKGTAYTTLEIAKVEAPYPLLSQLDFSRLKALASAERNAREDRLWALREDPGFFAETMSDYEQHRSEVLLDTYGQKHPTLKASEKPPFPNRIVGSVVVEAYFGLANFHAVMQQIHLVEEMADRYKTPRFNPRMICPQTTSKLSRF